MQIQVDTKQTSLVMRLWQPLPKADKLPQVEVNEAIDTDPGVFSSVKLLSILRLHKIDGCQLDDDFIIQIKQELQRRGDNQQWQLPR